MNALATCYLGLELPHPIVPGASPLADDIDTVLRLEDAGAGAIVMRSIFQEQNELEQLAAHRHFDGHVDAETAGTLPSLEVFALGLDTYLQQIRRIRERTHLKVIASLNGFTPGGWTEYARNFEEAGAHAMELNLYTVPTDVDLSAVDLEARQLEVVSEVARAVRLPVAVKLSPYYSSLPNFVRKLQKAGASGAVLFTRTHEADIDPMRLEAGRSLRLSTSDELLLRLRWLAIVSPQSTIDLAASGGVHASIDAVKAIMAGAHVVQVVSSLLQHGAQHLRVLLQGLQAFMAEQEYASVHAMRGSMNLSRAPNPSAYQRSDYVHLLASWHGTIAR
jgi:dihydroorotate dehydrogenase (fumarate)